MQVRNNYNECLTNLACSIRKYFDLDYKHNTIDYIDKILKENNLKFLRNLSSFSSTWKWPPHCPTLRRSRFNFLLGKRTFSMESTRPKPDSRTMSNLWGLLKHFFLSFDFFQLEFRIPSNTHSGSYDKEKAKVLMPQPAQAGQMKFDPYG